MLFAVIAGCTVVTGRFPRTAATFTWLLWIMTAIFMILGAGEARSAAHHTALLCISSYHLLQVSLRPLAYTAWLGFADLNVCML